MPNQAPVFVGWSTARQAIYYRPQNRRFYILNAEKSVSKTTLGITVFLAVGARPLASILDKIYDPYRTVEASIIMVILALTISTLLTYLFITKLKGKYNIENNSIEIPPEDTTVFYVIQSQLKKLLCVFPLLIVLDLVFIVFIMHFVVGNGGIIWLFLGSLFPLILYGSMLFFRQIIVSRQLLNGKLWV